jgi:hypothetical protein
VSTKSELAIQAIINAWVVSGRNPEYHKHMQNKLRKDWPILVKAIEELVKNRGV